jgi:hypothetical protein
MAATPQYGTMNFVGASGRTYAKDIYLSDVANASVRWDDGQGAGSATLEYWVAPEPVVLVDYSQVTGTADTTKLQITKNGVSSGDILRYTIHLTTLALRPRLRIMFSAGTQISAKQLA